LILHVAKVDDPSGSLNQDQNLLLEANFQGFTVS
jgi:hypothetical protein